MNYMMLNPTADLEVHYRRMKLAHDQGLSVDEHHDHATGEIRTMIYSQSEAALSHYLLSLPSDLI